MEKIFFICLVGVAAANHVHNAVQTEMFAIPISPNLFNWTYQEFDHQYRFHASLVGKPELPSWLRYIYSRRHHSGFIFGTPPRGIEPEITLEVIGINHADYETRRVLLTLQVTPKEVMARHEVELKVDNLNVEDLLDEHKMNRVKDILRAKLWAESSGDLYATFLASAVDLGARLPLKPSDGEGLVVRFGSVAPFSSELKRLREEVRPLSRLPSCPRGLKKTTVEKVFREADLMLDWCRFELYNTVYKERTTELLEYLTEIPNTSKGPKSEKALDSRDVWSAPSLHALPSRSYSRQLTTAVAAPLLLLLLAVAALTAVLCSHYAAMRDPVSENFIENIFHICSDYQKRRGHRSGRDGKVEVCRYGPANPEQSHVPDNTSSKSQGASPSGSGSAARPPSPRSASLAAGSYNRPQPPPYNNTLLHRRSTAEKTPSTCSHTPEHRGHIALEESLKLLNEANIAKSDFDVKEPILDLADGTEDYVPIKPDPTGYISIKAELDDIDVPELSKYGLGGVAI